MLMLPLLLPFLPWEKEKQEEGKHAGAAVHSGGRKREGQ